jgi:hypothetical protein
MIILWYTTRGANYNLSINTGFEETTVIFNCPGLNRLATPSRVILIICAVSGFFPDENSGIYAQSVPRHIAVAKDQPLSEQLNHFLTVIKKAPEDEWQIWEANRQRAQFRQALFCFL